MRWQIWEWNRLRKDELIGEAELDLLPQVIAGCADADYTVRVFPSPPLGLLHQYHRDATGTGAVSLKVTIIPPVVNNATAIDANSGRKRASLVPAPADTEVRSVTEPTKLAAASEAAAIEESRSSCEPSHGAKAAAVPSPPGSVPPPISARSSGAACTHARMPSSNASAR